MTLVLLVSLLFYLPTPTSTSTISSTTSSSASSSTMSVPSATPSTTSSTIECYECDSEKGHENCTAEDRQSLDHYSTMCRENHICHIRQGQRNIIYRTSQNRDRNIFLTLSRTVFSTFAQRITMVGTTPSATVK